jgi:hypothetical protein
MSKSLAAAALLLALTACQSSWSIHGQVASVPAGLAGQQDDEVTPVPLSRAKVTLRCPVPAKAGEFTERTVVADHLGLFQLGGTGAGPALDCLVIAEAPGHAPSITEIDEACADDDGGEGRCTSATLLAELQQLK